MREPRAPLRVGVLPPRDRGNKGALYPAAVSRVLWGWGWALLLLLVRVTLLTSLGVLLVPFLVPSLMA